MNINFDPIVNIKEDEREYLSDSDASEIEDKRKNSGGLNTSLRSHKSDDFKRTEPEMPETPVRQASVSMFDVSENDFTIFDLFKDRYYLLNLVIISLSWCASTVCFYIIGFYIKYIPGNVYNNMIITSIADAVSSISAGIVAEKIGAQKTLFISFMLAASFAFGLIISKNSLIILLCILVTRYGINSCFTLCYIVTSDYFPPIVSSQVFGLCNFFSRFMTTMAPMIAEMESPYPLIAYCLICVCSMLSTIFLSKNEDVEEALKELDDSLSIRSFMFKSSVNTNQDDSSDGDQEN